MYIVVFYSYLLKLTEWLMLAISGIESKMCIRDRATLLSFTKAANELFISQPAISKHIQELEKEYEMCIRDR